MPANRLPDIKLSDDQETRIVNYLRHEIDQALADRQEIESEWVEILDFYEKTELEEKKDFPFEGAAHLMLPLMATYTERMWARLHRTIWTPQHPFAAVPRQNGFQKATRPLRDFMTWASYEELEMKNKTSKAFKELVKLGSLATKMVYTERLETRYEYLEEVDDWVPVTYFAKDHPEYIHIPIDDFIFPPQITDLEDAEWKAHRVKLTWNELQRRERNGVYRDVDRIKNNTKNTGNQVEDARLAIDGIPTRPDQDRYEIFEIWFSFRLDDENPPYRLVAWLEKDTGTLLRIRHNWYPEQKDPFDICPFIPREHRVYGTGVGHMALAFQKEISVMHNQRLDNATIANVTGYTYRTDSMVGPNLRLQPGVGIPRDEADDFEAFQMGMKYDSTIKEEEKTLSYLTERLGIAQLNMEDQANLTNVMTIIQESAGKFDMIIDEVRRYMSRVMTKALMLYQKYYPKGKAFIVQGEDGLFVEKLFDLPPGALSDGIAISVTATSSTYSKELKRQAKLSLFNLLTQYYGQLTQYFMQSFSAEMPQPVRQAMLAIINGLSEFVLEILDDFDIHNRQELVIEIDRIRQLAAQQASAGAPAANGGQPGMENIQQPSNQGGEPSRPQNQESQVG